MYFNFLSISEFSPHHLVNYPRIGLYYLYDLGADVLVRVVGDGDAVESVAVEGDGGVDGLEEAPLVNAGDDEVALVDGFGPFGRGADADGREGMAHAGEE